MIDKNIQKLADAVSLDDLLKEPSTVDKVQKLADSVNLDDLMRELDAKESGGRGKRKCPECGTYCGVRSKLCICGHEFGVADAALKLSVAEQRKLDNAATQEEKDYALAVSGSSGGVLVYAGCGKCPAKFLGDDYDTVAAMCWEVVNEGLNSNKIYLPSAIKHWIGHRFGFNSKKYKKMCGHVDQWHKNVLQEV